MHSRLSHYYDSILRPSLLLKLNYNNIEEIPKLCEIRVLASCSNSSSLLNTKLALELICGQKFVNKTETSSIKVAQKTLGSQSLKLKNKKSNLFTKASLHEKRIINKNFHLTSINNFGYSVQSNLRAQQMYNFLDKFLIFTSFHNPKFQIQNNTIQIALNSSLIRLFPEIQNHFEHFECVQNFHISIITSANTENETHLLWAGFFKK
uniref:Ribosomal protein L5 n=2 Tax=Roya TaxID=43942 RepID=A0A6G9IET5_9VIRI|nr:ribosomal protein L5 [Roya obtusa]YP_009755731.1 ribosomal protein L5 [Roya anglica]AGZ90383.1 ribosomal protein L5 [Roya obtusa]QIQ22970.1 ribosomal protein L5 [Roya anglica]